MLSPFRRSRVVHTPKLRPLILRIPLSCRIAEAVHPLLCAALLFVAPRSAKRRVEPALCQRIQQAPRLQQTAAVLRSQRVRIRPRRNRLLIPVNDQLCPDLLCISITKGNHLGKLIARIHVQQRKWNLARIESLLRQPQHHARILADRVQHHRPRKLRHRLA